MNRQNQEARAAAKFAQIITRDRNSKPIKISVPGHEGRKYSVILKRNGKEAVAECLLDEKFGSSPCPSHSICYHIKAAVIAAAEDAGYSVAFTKTREDAYKLKNFGALVNKVVTKSGLTQYFATFEERTNGNENK